MNIVSAVGVYSDEVIDFSVESHLLEKANAYVIMLLLWRLDGHDALGEVTDLSQAHDQLSFVVLEVGLAQKDDVLVLNPVVGLVACSHLVRRCIVNQHFITGTKNDCICSPYLKFRRLQYNSWYISLNPLLNHSLRQDSLRPCKSTMHSMGSTVLFHRYITHS